MEKKDNAAQAGTSDRRVSLAQHIVACRIMNTKSQKKNVIEEKEAESALTSLREILRNRNKRQRRIG